MSKREQKYQYWEKLWDLVEKNPQILIVNADNVGSKQLQDCRKGLRGKGHMLFGKNTLIRAGISKRLSEPVEGDDDFERRQGKWFAMPQLERLQSLCRGNVGFIFCNGNINEVAEVISQHKRPAAARSGVLAPRDVTIPAGPTGLDPGMTSFFQALKIATKIAKNQIEIINEVKIIEEGKKIGNSEVALLKKLNIFPFEYELVVEKIYDDGSVYSPEVLKLTDDDVINNFLRSSENIAGLCLEIGYPTAVSVPHNIIAAFKNMVALTLEGDYSFKQGENLKDRVKNPEKFAVAGGAATGGASTAAAGGDAPAKEKTESEEADMGGLFGDDEDDY